MGQDRIETVAVVGGSVAGLLTAAAVAPYVAQVVVLDRDTPSEVPGPRPSTPQARHTHGLLASGREAMERLLPGLTAELVAQGALSDGDMGELGRWWIGGGLLARCHLGHRGMGVSRHLLEHQIRARVDLLPNVELRSGQAVLGLAGDRRLVRGVRVQRPGPGVVEESVEADLVVDASGRSGRGAAWLTDLGAAAPATERLRVGVRYVTVHVEAAPDDVEGARAVISAATPQVPRAAAAVRQEDGTWTVTLATYGDVPVPQDADGIRQLAGAMVSPDLGRILDGRESVHQPWAYRFPDSRRRRFERLTELPLGYVPVGDAMCSVNPTFGQGMSVAAYEAEALGRAVPGGREQVRRAYVPAAASVAGAAWSIAVGADLQVPGVTAEAGLRPSPALVGRYVRRVQRVARHDPDVAAAFLRVTNLLAPPPSLMASAVAARVLRPGSSRFPVTGVGARDCPPRSVESRLRAGISDISA